MHHQRVTAIQRGQDVLGPAVQPQDLGPGQPLDEAVGQREAQVGAVGAHAGQARAGQDGVQAATDGLHFGQFGQERSLKSVAAESVSGFGGLPRSRYLASSLFERLTSFDVRLKGSEAMT